MSENDQKTFFSKTTRQRFLWIRRLHFWRLRHFFDRTPNYLRNVSENEKKVQYNFFIEKFQRECGMQFWQTRTKFSDKGQNLCVQCPRWTNEYFFRIEKFSSSKSLCGHFETILDNITETWLAETDFFLLNVRKW